MTDEKGTITDENGCPCRYKAAPRDEETLRRLRNRLSRVTGQLGGISRMLDEGRYCGDILTQLAAVESALEAFGYELLRDHMETCVTEQLRAGSTEIIGETVELMKKLK